MALKMSKAALIAAIADKAGISKGAAAKALEALTETITGLPDGGELNINGFGKFIRKPTKARTARNPATGEQVDIPAGSRLTFKASKAA